MPFSTLLPQRLHNQKFIQSDLTTPAAIVTWLGAVQAQDFPAAKWALCMRARGGLLDLDVEQAFNDGAILRTHLLRPTWHFVTPADIRWMLMPSAPRVHAASAYYYRQAGLDARVFGRSCAMLQRALDGGHYLTRTELAVHLRRAKVPADGLKLAYLMMHAELLLGGATSSLGRCHIASWPMSHRLLADVRSPLGYDATPATFRQPHGDQA